MCVHKEQIINPEFSTLATGDWVPQTQTPQFSSSAEQSARREKILKFQSQTPAGKSLLSFVTNFPCISGANALGEFAHLG